MNRSVKNWIIIPAVFFTLFLMLPVFFSSCENSVSAGFGSAIDFEPPFLTLDPGANPRYMRALTELSGTVTDNIGVARVICREESDINRTNILGTAIITGTTWKMTLDTAAVQKTGKTKILAIVEAFDKFGNSGPQSTAAITMIIDLEPPIFSRSVIQRTKDRPTTDLMSLPDLIALETSDPDGEVKANVNLYQNGAFWIKASVSDEESTVVRDYTTLYIFDAYHDDDTLDVEVYKELAKQSGPSQAPEWMIREGDLILGGDNKGWDYSGRLAADERIYLRVSVVAQDRGGNSSREDFGYFCIYRKADYPKVYIDPWQGEYISPGTSLPIFVFDDDYLETAYIGMLTKSQWEIDYGTAVDSPGEDKLKDMEAKLKGGATVYNWKNDPAYGGETGVEAQISNAIRGNPEETVVSVMAGEDERDTGEFVVFGIVTDIKGDPHSSVDPLTRAASVTTYYFREITLIDSNSPLIVIDTVDTSAGDYDQSKHPGWDTITVASTGGSPEENTFPSLESGQYFSISGYTLDDDSADRGGVVEFKIAWIPFNIDGGQDAMVQRVKDALFYEDHPNAKEKGKVTYPNGVQHWDLKPYNVSTNNTSYLVRGTDQEIGEAGKERTYVKHTFRKRFDVLGGFDDINTGERNFNYVCEATTTDANGVAIPQMITDPANPTGPQIVNPAYGRENEAKLFVLFARDKDGLTFHRTIRLLGNKNPPSLKVYNFTDKIGLQGLVPPTEPDTDTAAQRRAKQAPFYPAISGTTYTDDDLLPSFMIFPRDTVLKIYAKAERQDIGDIQIESLKLYDITLGDASEATERGYYDATNRDLTYITSIPEVAQRLFLITAVNRLGVEIPIQRTVAVTTTAYLDEIITPEPSGTYPAGKEIMLQAHFAGQVKIIPGPGNTMPTLNIMYEINGTPLYGEVPFVGDPDKPTMYLTFPWTVPTNATGQLKTVDVDNDPGNNAYQRPINLNGAQIVDAERGEHAFLPGPGSTSEYGAPPWRDGEYSLQGKDGQYDPRGKDIQLDGILPTITSFKVDGKLPYDVSEPNHLYFKNGETIRFTLMASKPVRADGNPRIAFKIRDPIPPNNLSTGTYYANYERPSGLMGLIFEVDVSSANIPPDGTLVLTGLDTSPGNNVVDAIGNVLNTSNLVTLYDAPAADNVVVVDKTPPPATAPVLRDGSTTLTLNSSIINRFHVNPILEIIGEATSTEEPWGTFIRYSLNEGLLWKDAGDAEPEWTEIDTNGDLRIVNGQFKLRVIQVDKAGNESPASLVYELDIKGEFPKLIAISALEPDGFKLRGPVTINLDFDDYIYTTQTAGDTDSAYIIISDRTVRSTDFTQEHTARIYVTPHNPSDPGYEPSSTLTFELDQAPSPIANKMMENGITVMQIVLNGDVLDLYGNEGVNSSAAANYGTSEPHGQVTMADPAGSYGVTNLNGDGLKISTIEPVVISSVPGNANTADNVLAVLGGDRKTIKLTFNANMRKEMGTIVIKPHGTYPIPPVFPADAQILPDGTYIESFYEVFNSSLLSNADRDTLLRPDGWSSAGSPGANTGKGYTIPKTDDRTGQYTGPYRLNTQGLKEGPGYHGTNTVGETLVPVESGGTLDHYEVYGTAGAVTPGWYTGGSYMVPDTTSKYVLDYQYSINDATGVPQAIRTALEKAHFRWKEIDVISSNVTFEGSGASGRTSDIVVITLDNALNAGMRWELYIPEGTFTNIAGNPGRQIGVSPYETTPPGTPFWFWSEGVQAPVIRVDRKSIDHRQTVNTIFDQNFKHGTPAESAGGVNSSSFNTIRFKMESETPDAVITYGTMRGVATGEVTTGQHRSYNNGGYEAAWTGTIWTTFANTVTGLTINNKYFAGRTFPNGGNPNADTTTVSADPGTWMAPNLLRKYLTGRYAGGNGGDTNLGLHFYMPDESGNIVKRQGMGNLRLLRSYNRDATKGELDALSSSFEAAPTTLESSFSTTNSNAINKLMASKNYVVARASITHAASVSPAMPAINETAIGYEGVYKTVVGLLNGNGGLPNGSVKYFDIGNDPTAIVGSDLANGGPSIAGFPILPGTGDMRYLRVMAQDSSENQLLWISTEIVSPAYFAMCSPQNNSSLMSQPWILFGDAGPKLTGGYGDLTYSYQQDVK